jgi:hypothetical protein
MDYWLDLFTGTTWDEFKLAGANISGFRKRMGAHAAKVKPDDIFLCYLTGVMRWVGALKVVRPSNDTSSIWASNEFPVRFEVAPLILLPPEHGIPMDELEGRVTFYTGPKDRGKFKGFVRMSPNCFKNNDDAELILSLLQQAQSSPVARPVDEKKLRRTPMYGVNRKKGKKVLPTLVTVPESDENGQEAFRLLAPTAEDESRTASRHTEIQYLLLKLGADMGLNVWVARNDRGKVWNGRQLGDMPGMLSEVPTQFNEATNRTIELIDVLWLRGNSIVAAFEVECTT